MISMTKKELASIAGYTYRRLYDIDRDLPEGKKLFVEGEDGKYDLAIFVQKWVDYNVDHETPDSADLDVVKAKHEIVKTEKTQLEVDRLRGRLIDINDVKYLWGNIANTVMQNMLRLPSKLAPMLKMMENPEEIALIIDEEVRKVLTEIAETPLPDYANMDTEEGDDDEE